MLSTPTASTRKGTTSIVKSVVAIPAAAQTPIEHSAEKITISIPPNAREILLSS